MLYEPEDFTGSEQRYAQWVISTLVVTTLLMIAGLVLAHVHLGNRTIEGPNTLGRHGASPVHRPHPVQKGVPYSNKQPLLPAPHPHFT